MRMRIGILGGTFNPIHMGHLILAEEAYRILKLNKVIFIPCYLPPHKTSKNLISAEHRFNMVKEAIRGNYHFTVSDIEIEEEGISYTYKTLQKFKRLFPPHTEFFLIVGSDALEELPNWKNFNLITNLAKIVVATRANFLIDNKPDWAKIIKIPQLDISSSDIRKRIRMGFSIKYLVPERVVRYIEENKLYKNE